VNISLNSWCWNSSDLRSKMAVLWIVAPCSLVEVYQRFRGPCCLHHQGDLHSSYLTCVNEPLRVRINEEWTW
jgi:hypothetical protein